MTVEPGDATAELIDEAASLARRKVTDGRGEQAERFLRRYYARVPARDLQSRGVLDVYGAAMAHWSFAQQRQPGTARVRVYTPDPEQHGWQSTHSVVEIVTDNMPFVVDSVTMELSRRELGIHLVVHPTMEVRRDDDSLVEVLDESEPGHGVVSESFVHVEIDRQTQPDVLRGIHDGLCAVLDDVRAAVADWKPMRDRLHEILATLDEQRPPVGEDELEEARRFLEWLDDDHFTFIGFRAYDLERRDSEDVLVAQPETGLGVLRDEPASEMHFRDQPPEVRELAHARVLLILTKANSKSTVHRPSYLDYVGVKRFDAEGETIGEWRFLGLYTSRVYSAPPDAIPVVRYKVSDVLERANLPADSHDIKDLRAILESYPRDELFQVSTDELFDTTMGILGLQERRQVRLFVRRDRFGRFFSCLVFVPRDRYNTESRLRMQEVLTEAFGASGLEHSVRLSESVLARLHFIVRAGHEAVREHELEEVERRLSQAARTWSDDLSDALIDEAGEERGTQLFRTYGDSFPAGYRDDYQARIAVGDIERLERLDPDGDLAMSLYRPVEATEGFLRFKLYRSGTRVPLSEVLPLLENMGVSVIDQRPYDIVPGEGVRAWIGDFGLSYGQLGGLDDTDARAAFQEAFARVWRGHSENDGFNRLVLSAGFGWRDVTLLRAYSKYLRQTATRFSQAYMEDALVGNRAVTRLLRDLFHARLDPGSHDADTAAGLLDELEAALDDVVSLDEDRILRSFRDLIQATLRTNYFRAVGNEGEWTHLSLKLDPSRIPELPRPRPAFEIFVYSPRTEGVHLRGGEVARGGLRWSDRREDFRTEVLGLMKAQSVKNAVIVPVGAKGGFVVKSPPGDDRDAYRREVESCYRTFIRGLLDVTDNIVDGEVVAPDAVVRYDGDDPYLVVAADKGTATFSDTANEISQSTGFWLGDAFASGGSSGYDHKAMGITARGAWESVKRHFRDLGTDVQTTPFTVVGIGDMSGDVFGNGMLLSPHIRLVGAFDHRHIFLDPDPDPETSLAERKRLFESPASAWDDYERDAISAGGGVWSRSAKSIPLSAEARRALDVDAESLAPDELVSALLRAPVDLLFNGGIGTFVKASGESHAEVGDKTTDRVRVDATALRAKVVGEGGNLGFTQRARVEYALHGGRINTDAIDNSAGVDCSDHEVNIKVLLDAMVDAGELTSRQRNDLLVDMTDEVAGLVLRNNDTQNQALSNATANAGSMNGVHRRYLQHLEQRGLIDRELEFLPSDETMVERRNDGGGLVRPELAVLLAYTKTTLYDELLDSDVPEDGWLCRQLERYFPSPLRERCAEHMQQHRLRREIVATQVANTLVNDAGTTFLFRLGEETGASMPDIARAHAVSREVFDLAGLQQEVRALDNRIPAAVQTRMILEGRTLVERGTRWLLRNCRRPLDIEETVAELARGASDLAAMLPSPLRGSDRDGAEQRKGELVDKGVPAALAERVAALPALFCALDLVAVSSDRDEPIEDAAEIYFGLAERLRLDWLREQIAGLARDTRWDTLARDALREEFFTQHSALTAEVLRDTGPGDPSGERIEAWLRRNAAQVRRCEHILTEIEAASASDLAMLSVGLREIRNLVSAAV